MKSNKRKRKRSYPHVNWIVKCCALHVMSACVPIAILANRNFFPLSDRPAYLTAMGAHVPSSWPWPRSRPTMSAFTTHQEPLALLPKAVSSGHLLQGNQVCARVVQRSSCSTCAVTSIRSLSWGDCLADATYARGPAGVAPFCSLPTSGHWRWRPLQYHHPRVALRVPASKPMRSSVTASTASGTHHRTTLHTTWTPAPASWLTHHRKDHQRPEPTLAGGTRPPTSQPGP